MADSRAWALANLQDEPGASCSGRKQRSAQKNGVGRGNVLKGHKGQHKRAHSGQSWNNLNKNPSKIVLYSNPKYKINIQESVLIQISKQVNK